MSALPPVPRYRAAPADSRLICDMDVVQAVFHRPSGITHLIGEPVPQILAALDAIGVGDAPAIAAWLAQHYDLIAEQDAADVLATLSVRLDELAMLGLIERDMSCDT